MDTTTPETAPAITVNAILDRYLREYVPKKLAPRTQRDYVRHIVVLRRWYGERIASELKPKDFAEFLNIDKGKFQRVRQLAVLSSAFTEAVSSWYLIERNVLKDVKRPKGRPRDRLISDEEFTAFKAMAPLRVQLAMDLALVSGQRQGDILGMRWSQIKDMALHIEQTKTRKRIAITISAGLEAALDRCWVLPGGGCDGGEYVLTRRCGGRYTSEGFRALWQRVMRKWVRKGNQRFTFHDIRALCATKCPTIEHARALLGHSTMAMTRRVYRRGVERVEPLQTI